MRCYLLLRHPPSFMGHSSCGRRFVSPAPPLTSLPTHRAFHRFLVRMAFRTRVIIRILCAASKRGRYRWRLFGSAAGVGMRRWISGAWTAIYLHRLPDHAFLTPACLPTWWRRHFDTADAERITSTEGGQTPGRRAFLVPAFSTDLAACSFAFTVNAILCRLPAWTLPSTSRLSPASCPVAALWWWDVGRTTCQNERPLPPSQNSGHFIR